MDWVVVVDDDITNLKMAGRILSKNNMRVTALKSGTALLDYIKTNKPDLILLDIKMPGLDGFETMKRLQEQMNPSEKIPVIFLTADNAWTGSRRHGFHQKALHPGRPRSPRPAYDRSGKAPARSGTGKRAHTVGACDGFPYTGCHAARHFSGLSGAKGIRHLRQHGSGQGSRR